ncbi:hypothetical protein [Luteolibacter luteus]|uniref:DnaT DNA-binding domain-containing protein n=1 Tax=Luteolibacter luteus TaxID=2728835 RepID=A0A858RES4_9BACT|nr:hypothetical protein [Luteolibacter luteus]QJE95235.1 hypothetical protein HHL09_05415 [Luteolibacter luteus]
MPNRLLRDWTDSLRFDGISAEAERLFTRLIMKADDYGRFHCDPRLIKANCFPLHDDLTAAQVTAWLDELATRQLILRYEAEGRHLLAIVNYGQRLKQSRAKFPPPPGQAADFLPVSDHFRELPGTSGHFPLEEKQKRRELEAEARSGTPPAPPEPSSGGARAAGGSRRSPNPAILANINSLRDAWATMPELCHSELQAYFANEAALESIRPETWTICGEYMRATLRTGDPGWQPRSRLKYLEAPGDLVSHAQAWASKRPKPRPVTPRPPLSGDVIEDPAEALHFFRTAPIKVPA